MTYRNGKQLDKRLKYPVREKGVKQLQGSRLKKKRVVKLNAN